jgi:hypothetical protein
MEDVVSLPRRGLTFMKINISLAGWVLSLATFISGAVVEPLYQRFSFDGFSVQQTSNVRSVTQDPDPSKEHVPRAVESSGRRLG